MNEADTRRELIDPVLREKGWKGELIGSERSAGKIDLGIPDNPIRLHGIVDYLLRVRLHATAHPVEVALIEAKAEHLAPDNGLEQAKVYQKSERFNVPFVFASNGHLFVEFDRTTAKTAGPFPLAEFPTPDELRARYETAVGFSLADKAASPLTQPYPGGGATRRYYQDAAIRAVYEKIAREKAAKRQPRALLSLATGAGKTFIAVQLLKRIESAGEMTRALFVCDRDELREQAYGAFHAVFGNNAAKVERGPGNSNKAANARVHIATYQTLDIDDEDGEGNFLKTHYPEDYFSHIIIDECHRSAWGKWSEVLTRNPNAVHIGLTATPRQIKDDEHTPEVLSDLEITANNIRYFGEPVYEYTIAQAMEDGYLAACQLHKARADIDDNPLSLDQVMALGPINPDTGQPLTRDQLNTIYESKDYEAILQLPDRVDAMCRDLFAQMLDRGDPLQKTIIFCARDRHADRVATTMNNLYADWARANGLNPAEHFAFKCTAQFGSHLIPALKGQQTSHFVACTVDLLSTGVDVPAVRNVVFFKYVNSPISFYQMVGRGTRLDPETNKLMFRLYDYTDASRLKGLDFITKDPTERGSGSGGTGPGTSGPGGTPPTSPEPIAEINGLKVLIVGKQKRLLVPVDGALVDISEEEYRGRIAERLLKEASNLDQLRERWIIPKERLELMQSLPEGGNSAKTLRDLDAMLDHDLFDVLAHLGYKVPPLTRVRRVARFNYTHADWIYSHPGNAPKVLDALATQFALGGTDELEKREVFQTKQVVDAGGLAALKAAGEPLALMTEMKRRVFAA